MRDTRSGRRPPVRALLVGAAVAVALLVAWRVAVVAGLALHFGSGEDDRRFDTLAAQYGRRQAAFARADARMRELVAAHPSAERISWIVAQVCVTDAARRQACRPPTHRERAIYDGLWGVDVILHQATDDGRTFFRFYGDDPPRYTIVHAPGTDLDAYADDRGFRSTRALRPGWAILGPIPDLRRENRQWQR